MPVLHDAALFVLSLPGVRRRDHLATVKVVVADAVKSAPGLSVQRDGAPLDAAKWGTPVALDPGRHVFTATATGKQPWEKALDVPAEGATLTVTLDALADVATEAPPPPSEAASAWGPRRIAGVATGALGVIFLAAGTGLGVQAINKNKASNADGHCRAGNQCDAIGVDLRSASISAGNASTALIVLGGAATVAGVVLFVTAPKPAAAQVALGPGRLSVTGRF